MANLDISSTNRLKGFGLHKETIPVVLTAAVNIADTIAVAVAPAGTVIHDISGYTSGVASSTLSVGDTSDTARYGSAISTASAGYFAANVGTTVTSGVITKGKGYKYTADNKIVVTVAGANLPIGTTLLFQVEYTNVIL